MINHEVNPGRVTLTAYLIPLIQSTRMSMGSGMHAGPNLFLVPIPGDDPNPPGATVRQTPTLMGALTYYAKSDGDQARSSSWVPGDAAERLFALADPVAYMRFKSGPLPQIQPPEPPTEPPPPSSPRGPDSDGSGALSPEADKTGAVFLDEFASLPAPPVNGSGTEEAKAAVEAYLGEEARAKDLPAPQPPVQLELFGDPKVDPEADTTEWETPKPPPELGPNEFRVEVPGE